MSLNLKDRILKIFKGQNENQDEPKHLTISEIELNEMVEKRANELLDKELATLDKAFLKEVSEGMKSINVDESNNKQLESKEQQVKDILNNKE